MTYALVVEDDPDVQEIISAMLEELGLTVIRAAIAADALAAIAGTRPTLAVLDAGVPGSANLLKELEAKGVPSIMTSGHPDIADRFEAQGLPFLPKPFRARELQATALRLLINGDPDAES